MWDWQYSLECYQYFVPIWRVLCVILSILHNIVMDPNNVMVQFERDALYSLEIKPSYMPSFVAWQWVWWTCICWTPLVSVQIDVLLLLLPKTPHGAPSLRYLLKHVFFYSHVTLGTLFIMELLHTNVCLVHLTIKIIKINSWVVQSLNLNVDLRLELTSKNPN